MVWTILGLLCLIVATVLIFKIKEVKLGVNASRFLAVIFAIFGYFFLHTKLAFLNIGKVIFGWQKWGVLAVMIIAAVICALITYKKRDDEFKFVIQESLHVFGIVVLCLAARIFFSL